MSVLCPNCWNRIAPDAPACPTCGALFGPESEWQPVIDDGAPHPAPLDPAYIRWTGQSLERVKEPHDTKKIEAERGNHAAMAARLLFGTLALLIGALVVYATVPHDLRAMTLNHKWPGNYWMDALFGPLIAATLLGFGFSQWLQVLWIGDDADFDAQLYAKLTPREQRRHDVRRAAASDLAGLCWVLLCALALGEVSVSILKGVIEGSLAPGDLAAPLIATLLALAGAVLQVRAILWPRRGAATQDAG